MAKREDESSLEFNSLTLLDAGVGGLQLLSVLVVHIAHLPVEGSRKTRSSSDEHLQTNPVVHTKPVSSRSKIQITAVFLSPIQIVIAVILAVY